MGGVAKKVGKAVGSLVGAGGGGDTVIQGSDPAAERIQAEREAAAAANAKSADLSRARKKGSLLAAGGNAEQAQTSSVLAYGKNRLGE